MGKFTKSVEIATSPQTTFDFINDMDKMNRVHEGFTQAKYTTNGPVGVGTTAHFVSNPAGSHMEWDMRITEFEQNRKLTWSSLSPNKMTMIFTIEPLSNGTRLTHHAEYEVPYPVIGKLIDKFRVSKEVEKEITLELEKTKKALETQQV